MSQLDPQALDELASEYVLGTLTAEQRQYVQKLMQQDLVVKQRVQAWEERLNPLATAVPPVSPPADVWRAIEEKIFADRGPVISEPPPAIRWRWTGAAAIAAAIILGVGLSLFSFNSTVPESYVGVLSAANSREPAMHASALRHNNQLSIKMIKPITIAADQILVLWALPKNEKPLRIGAIAPSGKTAIQLPAEAEIVFKGVSTLAVAVETADETKPTITPDEFLLSGPCVKLW